MFSVDIWSTISSVYQTVYYQSTVGLLDQHCIECCMVDSRLLSVNLAMLQLSTIFGTLNYSLICFKDAAHSLAKQGYWGWVVENKKLQIIIVLIRVKVGWTFEKYLFR